MIQPLVTAIHSKLPQSCISAETLYEIVKVIRSIPEYKRLVVSVKNSDSARDSLVNITGTWVAADRSDLFDYSIAASIIALADGDREAEAISLSSEICHDSSLDIASDIANSYLLQKALE